MPTTTPPPLDPSTLPGADTPASRFSELMLVQEVIGSSDYRVAGTNDDGTMCFTNGTYLVTVRYNVAYLNLRLTKGTPDLTLAELTLDLLTVSSHQRPVAGFLSAFPEEDPF